MLQEVEADAKIAVGHLYYDTSELKDVPIDAAAHGGNIDAKIKLTSSNKEHAAAKIGLKKRGNTDKNIILGGFIVVDGRQG